MSTMREISITAARRLAIASQCLVSGPGDLLETIRALGCLQLDPTSAVAKSHLLVLWSRLGTFDLAELDKLLWQDRQLFEYWAHAASIVLTEHYPLHHLLMRRYGNSDNSAWSQRLRAWVKDNDALRRYVLAELDQRGPMQLKDFEGHGLVTMAWQSGGWTSGRNVDRMVDYLWTAGQVMVAQRKSGQRYWDLSERVLPEWTPREELPEHEIVRRACEIAIKALGVCTARHINYHFTRNRYDDLPAVLSALESEKRIARVTVVQDGRALPGSWYIHQDSLAALESIEKDEWTERTTLLSPFDNLICDRKRTEVLFNFKYTIEIYVPKHKRQFGYFVLPILHGDRLIGRIDPLLKRKEKVLEVNNVYAEADAPLDAATGHAVGKVIRDLSQFLGAENVVYGENMPSAWKAGLLP